MKSKKIYAILTLVVFMMTLLPMAAFADAGNRFASFMQTDKTTVTADGAEKVKVQVYLYDGSNNAATDAFAYVATYRGTTDKLYYDSGLTQPIAAATNGAGADCYGITNSSGVATFYVASTVAGTTKIAAGLTNGAVAATNLYKYLVGDSATSADSVQLIGSPVEVTFTAGSANAVTATAVADNVTGPSFSISGTGSSVELSSSTGAYAKGNNTEYYEVSFKVVSSGGSPVKDAEVNFSVSDPALSLNKTTATTDTAGIAKVKVTASKGFSSFSDYVKAASGDKSCKVYLKYDANAAFRLVLTSGGNEVVAKDKPYTLKFKLYDLNDNQIRLTDTTKRDPNYFSSTITFEGITKPTDVKLIEKITEQDTTMAYAEMYGDSSGQYIITFKTGVLNKEGEYVIKAYLANGAYVNIPFTVKKQGTITRMELSYDSTTVAQDGVTSGATIKYYDAENIVEKVTSHSSVVFSVSPAPVADAITQTTGEIKVADSKDYIGDFTVTAVNNDKNLAATTTLMMTRDVATVKVENVGTAAPGESARVEIQLYDIDGKKTAFGSAVTPELDQKVVSSKPADSIATVTAAGDFASKMKQTGASYFDVKCTKAGTVVVDFVIKAGTQYYPGQATVTFEAAAPPKVVIGAAKVTMFIGATGYVSDGTAMVTDVAPFIQEGRTFVAVRPVADAFGCEIGWNEATQTVTLTRSDKVVTIVIGSDAITVVEDGVTTTVTADQPAFIKDGRTVLPFRAVGDAFGATVDYDAATQAVSYEQ